MRRYTHQIICIFILLFYSVGLHAQIGTKSPFSNLRYKTIRIKSDSLKIDSLAIAPGSFYADNISDTNYQFYPEHSLLVWKHKPAQDSIHIRYRILPLAFDHVYSHKDSKQIDSGGVSYIYKLEDKRSGNFVDLKQLEYNGSYGRSISLGNNQDVVLNSQFNLQVNGYILDSIKLEAAMTDNTIPFQPEGNTQQIQQFDQIYIRLRKHRDYLQIGDYNLDNPPGYFLKFNKRVQGLYYQTGFDINKHTTNKLGLSGSISKGQFARNIFQGLEGNQGPYKLTGNNGEQFFVVLAGTEKVYVNNVLMERGQNADYTINYNTAEITFMPRKMITKDSRIQVEFEYQDKNYLNSLFYVWDELQVGKKLNVRFNAYSNQDAKNQPYLQNLSGDQKSFLGTLGDSIQNAFYPSIARDTFAANKILYKMIDTTVSGILYDSVFVYSTNPDSAIYSLGFSYVGAGRGNYIISSGNTNGRSYYWVAPVNGIPQGNYQPVQLLVTPKKKQLFIVTTNYQIDSLKKISVEVGVSNQDPNLFSKIDNQTHWGLATKVNYTELRLLGVKDSSGKSKWKWKNQLSYEYVQDRFSAIAPYRDVEFGRDWNVPQSGVKPDENLINATTEISNKKLGTAAYHFSFYKRGNDYSGFKNVINYDYNYKAIKAGFVANAMTATDTFQTSKFYRPIIYAEYNLKQLMNTYLGAKYELQHNEIFSKNVDSLLPTAFSNDVTTIYLKTADQQKIRWGLSYFTRRDRFPVFNKFIQRNHSDNVDVKIGLAQWKNQSINFTGTYRKLTVDDSTASNLKPEETLLGRMEYTGSALKNFAAINSLYEFGSGQEQKRSYTYVEVPAGQGVYTWIDYNNDGVQQANEFEVALYPDQKKFIKVFTPTNDYIKVNYVNFNFSLTLDPSRFWNGQPKRNWQKFVSKLSSQTSLQIGNRLLADEGLKAYNPFIKVLLDTSIIITNSSLSNSIYFNRANPKWGIDYNLLYNTGKQLLTYGVEGNQTIQNLYKIRWNVKRPITINFTAKNGDRSYASALKDNRTYNVKNWSLEPSLTWLYRSIFRITSSLKYEDRKNEQQYGGEHANIQNLNLEFRYSKASLGVIQISGMYANIQYDGLATDPVAYVMLDALQKGNNYLWRMNWERRVGKGIEMSIEYEGRKPGNGTIIHTGRMSIRAIL